MGKNSDVQPEGIKEKEVLEERSMEEENGKWKSEVVMHLCIPNTIKYSHCAAKMITYYTYRCSGETTKLNKAQHNLVYRTSEMT